MNLFRTFTCGYKIFEHNYSINKPITECRVLLTLPGERPFSASIILFLCKTSRKYADCRHDDLCFCGWFLFVRTLQLRKLLSVSLCFATLWTNRPFYNPMCGLLCVLSEKCSSVIWLFRLFSSTRLCWNSPAFRPDDDNTQSENCGCTTLWCVVTVIP